MTAGSPKDAPSPESTDLVLATALSYIEAGIRCHPVHPPIPNDENSGKAPRPKLWGKRFLDASAFKRYYREGDNIGVVTGKASGLFVVDIDPENGGDAWYFDNEDRLGHCLREKTGSGGFHLYYKYPKGHDDVPSHCGKEGIAPGVEIHADHGHQVVTWPSRHYKGTGYAIEYGLSLLDLDAEADEPPGWLLEIALSKPTRLAAPVAVPADFAPDQPADVAWVVQFLKEVSAPTAGHGRNNDTYLVACRCRSKGLAYETAVALMKEHYIPRTRGGAPYSIEKLRLIVRNAYQYSKGSLGEDSASTIFSEPIQDHTLTEDERDKQEREIIGEFKFALKRPIMCAELILGELSGRMKSAKDVVYLYSNPDRVWHVATDTEVMSNIMEFVRERDAKAYKLLKPSKLKEIATMVQVMLECERFRPVENTWLSPAHGYEPGRPVNCIRMENGILDIESRKILPHSPDWFSMTKLPFSYEPEAPCPMFDRFLTSIWGSDEDVKDCLKLWMGYLLLSDVREQKFALLIGASRAGKGILSRVMERMIGPDATVGCTLSALANDHGLSMLVGKRLVVFGDVVKAVGNVGEIATERLISIIGQDLQVINRKFHDSYSVVLPIKLVLACNDFPLFMNNRQALSNRMLVFPFSETFAGREDPLLDDRLQGEVSGIMNFALDGASRLLKGERLRQPLRAEETFREIRKKMDSVLAFIEDCGEYRELSPWVAKDTAVESVRAYSSYQTWCKERGHAAKNIENFVAAVIAHGNGNVSKERVRRGGRQVTVLLNFELTGDAPGEFN